VMCMYTFSSIYGISIACTMPSNKTLPPKTKYTLSTAYLISVFANTSAKSSTFLFLSCATLLSSAR
jgi:hypothetical protein